MSCFIQMNCYDFQSFNVTNHTYGIKYCTAHFSLQFENILVNTTIMPITGTKLLHGLLENHAHKIERKYSHYSENIQKHLFAEILHQNNYWWNSLFNCYKLQPCKDNNVSKQPAICNIIHTLHQLFTVMQTLV